jgi:hypothetical protein
MSTNSPTFPEKYLTLSKDLDFQLKARLSRYLETENPVYVWRAIKLCTDYNLPFPDWVAIYLSTVANNMLSARQCSDLREVLPRVLLFPKKKRGPGRLLDPDAALEDRMLLTIKFLCKLKENAECEPEEALQEALHDMDVSVGDKSDETHWTWLTEELGLTERPKTTAEWVDAGNTHYFSFYKLVVESYDDHVARQAGDGDAGQTASPESPARKDR